MMIIIIIILVIVVKLEDATIVEPLSLSYVVGG